MRSAGTVRDEIRFNSTTQKWEAVQKVGVRTFTDGDDADTTVITDGKNTNYELAAPIVTEITDVVDMTYNVYDFGTEELLVAEGESSAPFNGEIVYQFNAVDRIRDNERNINVLNKEVKTLIPKNAVSTDVLLANGNTQPFNKEDRQFLTAQVASVVSLDMGILSNGVATFSLNQKKFNTLQSASMTKIFTMLNGVQYVFGNACKEIVNSGRVVYSQMFFASADTQSPFKMFKMEVAQQGTSSQYIATATIQDIDMTVLTSIAE